VQLGQVLRLQDGRELTGDAEDGAQSPMRMPSAW
jgi:hypothetical protein